MIGLLISANLIQLVVYLVRMRSIPPQIPLFYSLPVGEDQLVEWWMIFLIPVLMNTLVIANALLLRRFFSQDPFTRSVIRHTNTVLMLISTYIFLRIVLLVS